MRMIVTAGPTREYLDDVRFITNASSGRMGCAVAAAAVGAGHEVTLLAGPGVAVGNGLRSDDPDESGSSRGACPRGSNANQATKDGYRRLGSDESGPRRQSPEIVRFVSVEDLRRELAARFADCDALVMTAAVGDFRPSRRVEGKIPRAGGPVTITLVPTEDVLASVTARRRPGQVVVAFAVESLPAEAAAARARAEMAGKNADLVVVNGPEAMEAEASSACVLSGDGVVLDWAVRPKAELARLLVEAVAERFG